MIKDSSKSDNDTSVNSETDERPCLLIVDDERGILDSYQHYLGASPIQTVVKSARYTHRPSRQIKETYRLLLADTGEKAVDLVVREYQAGREIQAGFFDMKMPGGIDGLETIRRIRKIDENIYCVIVTAYQDRSLDEIGRVFGRANNHWDYLNKPFTGNEIIQKARNAIAFWTSRKRHETVIREMEATNRKLAEEFRKRVAETGKSTPSKSRGPVERSS